MLWKEYYAWQNPRGILKLSHEDGGRRCDIGSLEVPQYDAYLPMMPSPNFVPGSSPAGDTSPAGESGQNLATGLGAGRDPICNEVWYFSDGEYIF